MTSRNRILLLLTLTTTPLVAYLYLKSRQSDTKTEARRIEEEGRRAWSEQQKLGHDARERDFAVRVGRSGGGV